MKEDYDDGVGDVWDHLDGFAKVLSLPLVLYYIHVNLPGRDIVVASKLLSQKALIRAQV